MNSPIAEFLFYSRITKETKAYQQSTHCFSLKPASAIETDGQKCCYNYYKNTDCQNTISLHFQIHLLAISGIGNHLSNSRFDIFMWEGNIDRANETSKLHERLNPLT